MEPELGTLGDRVRWARKRAGLSLQALAHLAGINKDTIHGWERGRVEDEAVREANLKAVAPHLRVTWEWLREGGPTPRIPPAGASEGGTGSRTRTPGRRTTDKAIARLADLEDAGETARKQLAEYERAGKAPPSYQILAWFEMLERAATPPTGDPDPLGRPTPPEGHPIGPGGSPPPPRAAGDR